MKNYNFKIFWLNIIYPRIEFTFEIEENRQLSFLDLLIKIKQTGSLGYIFYRKPRHTNISFHGN